MKKTLIILGVVFAFIILIIGAFVFFSLNKANKINETAIPYIEKTLPILSAWDTKTFRSYMIPLAMKDITDESFDKTIHFLSKVGALEDFSTPTFQNIYTSTNLPTIITYNIKAKYANGDATVEISLVESSNSYKVYRFNLNSKALME